MSREKAIQFTPHIFNGHLQFSIHCSPNMPQELKNFMFFAKVRHPGVSFSIVDRSKAVSAPKAGRRRTASHKGGRQRVGSHRHTTTKAEIKSWL